MTNVTITGNTVTPDAGYMGSSRGGGVFFGEITAQMTDTLMAGNTAATEDPDCYSITQVTSGGHNLVQTQNSPNCGITTVEGDLTGVDPLLGPLADNGGPTMTHALLSISPAIDAGGPSCAGTDRRGLARTDCDIGAYELVFCRGIPVNRVGTLEGIRWSARPGGTASWASAGGTGFEARAAPTDSVEVPARTSSRAAGARTASTAAPAGHLCRPSRP